MAARSIPQLGFICGILTLTLIQLLQRVSQVSVPQTLSTFLALASVGFALAMLDSKGARIISLTFLTVGTVLFAVHAARPDQALASLSTNTSLVTVILYAPLVALIFDAKPFGASLISLLGRVTRNEVVFTSAVIALTSVVAIMTSVAAMVIIYTLLAEQARSHDRWRGLLTDATLRGYGNGVLWAPTGVTAAIALEYSGSRLSAFVPAAVGLAALALILHSAFSWWKQAAPQWRPHPQLVPVRDSLTNTLIFALVLLLFVSSVAAVHRVTSLSIVDTISLVCPCFALGFFAITGRTRLFNQRVATYVRQGIPRRAADSAIILSAGYFVGGLDAAGLTARIASAFVWVVHSAPMLQLPALSLGLVALGCIGLSPILSLLLVTSAIDPTLLTASSAAITLSLTLGTAVALMMSPFSSPIFLLSSVSGVNTIDLGIKRNWKYGVALFVVGQAYLVAMS